MSGEPAYAGSLAGGGRPRVGPNRRNRGFPSPRHQASKPPISLVDNLLITSLAPTAPGTHFSIYTRGRFPECAVPRLEVRRISGCDAPPPQKGSAGSC